MISTGNNKNARHAVRFLFTLDKKQRHLRIPVKSATEYFFGCAVFFWAQLLLGGKNQ
ncbi:MAG: hypothetical protein Q7T25_12470 [Sideroxyarcus sp.]|nr:hypothetical protein [Sideroxyarcus sp.]